MKKLKSDWLRNCPSSNYQYIGESGFKSLFICDTLLPHKCDILKNIDFFPPLKTSNHNSIGLVIPMKACNAMTARDMSLACNFVQCKYSIPC